MNQTKQHKNGTQYFVIYGPFANTYKVYSARHEETIERLYELGAERIGPLQAFGLIEAERLRSLDTGLSWFRRTWFAWEQMVNLITSGKNRTHPVGDISMRTINREEIRK